MMTTEQIRDKVKEYYGVEGELTPFGNGHINDTFRVMPGNLLLQKININVFKDPEGLMNNICLVTGFLQGFFAASGEDPERRTLTVIPAKNGGNYVEFEPGEVFRMYKLIDHTYSIDHPHNMDELYSAGYSFAEFMNQLASFPAEQLVETIPNFHHTPTRFQNLKNSIQADQAGRRSEVQAEIAFALEQESWISTVVDGLADGSLPLRVTHNDTKINNILYDEVSKKALAVVDLDTVMPGSMLYDFGDALRMGASTAEEDEPDTSKILFDQEAFRTYCQGYADAAGSHMTRREIELLPLSVKLMTYECGIRFLADYLDGDVYFKIHREKHNLDRARSQFKLVYEIQKHEAELDQIVKEVFAPYLK